MKKLFCLIAIFFFLIIPIRKKYAVSNYTSYISLLYLTTGSAVADAAFMTSMVGGDGTMQITLEGPTGDIGQIHFDSELNASWYTANTEVPTEPTEAIENGSFVPVEVQFLADIDDCRVSGSWPWIGYIMGTDTTSVTGYKKFVYARRIYRGAGELEFPTTAGWNFGINDTYDSPGSPGSHITLLEAGGYNGIGTQCEPALWEVEMNNITYELGVAAGAGLVGKLIIDDDGIEPDETYYSEPQWNLAGQTDLIKQIALKQALNDDVTSSGIAPGTQTTNATISIKGMTEDGQLVINGGDHNNAIINVGSPGDELSTITNVDLNEYDDLPILPGTKVPYYDDVKKLVPPPDEGEQDPPETTDPIDGNTEEILSLIYARQLYIHELKESLDSARFSDLSEKLGDIEDGITSLETNAVEGLNDIETAVNSIEFPDVMELSEDDRNLIIAVTDEVQDLNEMIANTSIASLNAPPTPPGYDFSDKTFSQIFYYHYGLIQGTDWFSFVDDAPTITGPYTLPSWEFPAIAGYGEMTLDFNDFEDLFTIMRNVFLFCGCIVSIRIVFGK